MITFSIAILLATTQPKKTVDEWAGISISSIEPAPKPLEASKFVALPEVVIDTPAPAEQPPVASGTVNCGDNQYKQFIYEHESGCNTASKNAGGCFGLGQDCNNIVEARCGTDFACQDAYFSNYAQSRYGGWQQAYNFWVNNNWW